MLVYDFKYLKQNNEIQYSLVASNGSQCKQSLKKIVLTQNVKIVFMLQIKVLSPLMINANDF